MRLFILLIALLATSFMPLHAAEKAPSFSLPHINKEGKLSLSQYKGRVVYLDFWASWCGPCRKSLPMLNDLRKELKNKKFEVIAINLDEDIKDARKFLKKYPVDYPVLYDAGSKIPPEYKMKGMPTSYLIDQRGRIQKVHQGFKPSHMADIRRSILKLLEK